MNNTCEITLGGKKYTLTFGMMAMEVLESMALADTKELPKGFESTCITIYSGIANECKLARVAAPAYRDICGLLEDAILTEDGATQIISALECFSESKFGKRFLEQGKKKTDVGNQSEPITTA